MAAGHLPGRESPPLVDAVSALSEAQSFRDRIRQGAFWANSPEFDHAVRMVYQLEEAAEAALDLLAARL